MTNRILMCPPDYFSIKYEINPWMSRKLPVDKALAQKQWKELFNTLKDTIELDIELLEPQKNLPDYVFTANAALVRDNKALISSFKYKERQQEAFFSEIWFKQNGFIVENIPESMIFEGEGDGLFLGPTLYLGYLSDSNTNSHSFISEFFNVPIVSLELVDGRFYHLDTCFCPLIDGYLMYYPAAFSEESNKKIEKMVSAEKRVIVTKEEAFKFACNSVCIKGHVVSNFISDRIKKILIEIGLKPVQINLSEFIKSGGSAKCLVLKLD